MTIRPFEETDYQTVKQWWIGHGFPEFAVPAYEFLPDDGLIIDDVCVAWVYLSSNSPMCRLGWPLGNPETSGRTVYKGLKQVILQLHEFARSKGCPLMEATFSDKGLCRFMGSLDFQTGDTNLTGFIKGL